MERFEMNIPKAKGSAPMIDIADLIPFGRDNAIPRTKLVGMCIMNDLCKDDRTMRALLQRAKMDYVILAREDGGYYRPTKEDAQDLARYIRQEEKRAKSVFKSISMARKLYEDFKRGIV